jgi:hypothetical protein
LCELAAKTPKTTSSVGTASVMSSCTGEPSADIDAAAMECRAASTIPAMCEIFGNESVPLLLDVDEQSVSVSFWCSDSDDDGALKKTRVRFGRSPLEVT